MREYKIKLYRFEELDDAVVKKMIEENRDRIGNALLEDVAYYYEDTIKKLEELLDFKLVDYRVDGDGYVFDFDPHGNDVTLARAKRTQAKSKDDCGWFLTGCYADGYVIRPLKDGTEYKETIADCLNALFDGWSSEYQTIYNDDDVIEQELDNEYSGDLFYANGQVFKGILEYE